MNAMKKTRTYFYFRTLALAGLLFMQSCQKDLDYVVADPNQPSGPDTSWVSAINPTLPVAQLLNSLKPDHETDSAQINFGATSNLLTSSGLSIRLRGGLLVNGSNTPVTGTILAETQFLQRKGDFIRMNIPTLSNGQLFESHGAFFLRFTQAGAELRLGQQQSIQVGYNDPQAQLGTKLFFGETQPTAAFNWVPAIDSTVNFVTVATNQSYLVNTNALRWIQNAKPFDTAGRQMTRLAVSLPAQYTNANTAVFLVFNNYRMVLPLFGNPAVKKFTSASLPANERVTAVVISKMGNDYFYGQQELTTAMPQSGAQWQEFNTTGLISTFSNINNSLDSL